MKRATLAALLCSLPVFGAESGGQAEIVFQGYYLGGNAQVPERIGGVVVNFRDFFPGLGVLSGNLEGYANGQFQTGDNFLELQGLPWLGRRWAVRGGDFQIPSSLVDFPFHNIFNPEVTARGARIATRHGATEYEFFYGRETLEEGPQVPFRVTAPQTVMGASARYEHGRVEAGVRYMRFSSTPDDILKSPFLFPSGRDFARVDSLTAQLLYRLARNLRLYGEASGSAADKAAALEGGRREPLSMLGGLAWETPKVTVRANYARQGVLYFPLAGYYAGDRQGPFAEMQYRPWKAVELLGSASHYRNNLEQNPNVATFQSTSTSTGATVRLPGAWTGLAQLSTIRFQEQPAGGGPASDSTNRHLSAGLTRPFRRHTLRFTMHDLKFTANSLPERQRWVEGEDTFRLKRFMLGANVRFQQALGGQSRNTVYVRGIAQFNTRRFTAFANVETGNDLLNQTVFATNTYRTTVAGITAHLDKKWDLQAEAFRNSLNMTLNPESIFVLETGGVGLSNSLSSLDQWSVFIRLKRQLQWGRTLPSGDLDRYVDSQLPLEGAVEGFVFEQRMAGQCAAAEIPVSLDDNRTVTTDGDGRFRFSEVPEGVHRVLLSGTELPADYDRGTTGEETVAVHPRRTTRATLSVVRLTSLAGKVTGSEKAPLEHILIRLLPAGRYTTTREDGGFAFHNLREGDYEAVIDESTLPEGAVLAGAPRVPVVVRLDAPAPEIHFVFLTPEKRKTVHKIDLP